MAHGRGLKLVGLAYGGIVAIVAMIAIIVVTAHVNTPVEARTDQVIVSSR